MRRTAKLPMLLGAMARMGRLAGVLTCALVLMLAMVLHTGMAASAFAAPAVQTTSHDGGHDGADLAAEMMIHCTQHNSCTSIMPEDVRWARPAMTGLAIAVEPDMAIAGPPPLPPDHPPKS